MPLPPSLTTKSPSRAGLSSSGASAIRNACRVSLSAWLTRFGHPLTEADRHALRVEMNEALGYYPLMTLATEDVLQNALDVYGEEEAAKLMPISTPPAITSRANGAATAKASAWRSIGRSKTPSLMPRPTASR